MSYARLNKSQQDQPQTPHHGPGFGPQGPSVELSGAGFTSVGMSLPRLTPPGGIVYEGHVPQDSARLSKVPHLERLSVYQGLSSYFGNPTMKKIKFVKDQVMYGCKIRSALRATTRYILVFVPSMGPLQDEERLANLRWTCLQTRSLVEEYDVPSHSYMPSAGAPVVSEGISVLSRGDDKDTFTCATVPVTITLLYKKNASVAYNATGTISAALETYNTVVEFRN